MSSFNISTFGPKQQSRYISDIMKGSSGIQNVIITGITEGSVVVHTHIDILSGFVAEFAANLAEGPLLELGIYGLVLLIGLPNRNAADVAKSISPTDPCNVDCPSC